MKYYIIFALRIFYQNIFEPSNTKPVLIWDFICATILLFTAERSEWFLYFKKAWSIFTGCWFPIILERQFHKFQMYTGIDIYHHFHRCQQYTTTFKIESGVKNTLYWNSSSFRDLFVQVTLDWLSSEDMEKLRITQPASQRNCSWHDCYLQCYIKSVY